jgi:drug/metabolite transporter (DMT)-like permease
MASSVALDSTLNPQRRERQAVLMLLAACVLWGMSFNWSKDAQDILGRRLAEASGDDRAHGVGPAAFLAVRFLVAGILWAVLFPRSLRGWSAGTVRAGALGGSLLAIGMLLQHYGLAQTSESLSAFLTSLVVLFTPLMATGVLKHRISARLWVCVVCATVGVALMTLYRDEGRFDEGALLGLLCAVVFSVHILVVDAVGKRETAWRFALGQFAVSSAIFTTFAGLLPAGTHWLDPAVTLQALASPRFWWLMGLTVVLSTIVCFGLMFSFQPRTSPTRAALIYLTEPIFATVYAWLAVGRTITATAMAGAALILLANGLAEWLGQKEKAPRGG